MRRPADQERLYLEAVLATYSSLPGTPARPSRQDRRLARDLCRRGVPLRTVRTALLLAAARRTLRSGPPLPPVRTLHYFLPAIEEVLEQPARPRIRRVPRRQAQALRQSEKRASWRALTRTRDRRLAPQARPAGPPLRRSRPAPRSDHDPGWFPWRPFGRGPPRTQPAGGSPAAPSSVSATRSQSDPPTPPASAERQRAVRARYPNHVWMLDLTEIPGFLRLFSFKLAVVLDAFSRAPLAARVFYQEPSGRDIAMLLARTARRFGRPRHSVSDQGAQFTSGSVPQGPRSPRD